MTGTAKADIDTIKVTSLRCSI